MTPAQIEIAKALGRCSFLPGTWDKRFVRNMAAAAESAPDVTLTERQFVHLIRLSHRYRRQLPSSIVALALDEAEQAAERWVSLGKGALVDFTPARAVRAAKAKERRERKMIEARRADPQLGLFGGAP